MRINKLLMFIVCLFSLIHLAYATDHVVISELGVDPTNQWDGKRFIELYNPTNTVIDISGWSIVQQAKSPSLNFIIPSNSFIKNHSYYLIADKLNNGSIDWPSIWNKPDRFTNLELSSDYGIKLQDRSNNAVDRVGWGSIILLTDYYETQPLNRPISGHSFERKPGSISPSCGNWQDTNNNSNDFLDNSNPSPQNSSFTEQPCDITVGCITNEDCNNLDTNCADGVCNLQTRQCEQSFKPSTTECRAAAGVCDIAEKCTGTSANCPADAKSTAQCRASAGDCDVAENCDGVNNNCPLDTFRPNTYQCRASTGVCDLEEKCTGSSTTCPSDSIRPNTYECRAAAGDCDIAEKCDGITKVCPSDTKKSAGTLCGQARDCQADGCNGYFVEFYPNDGHDTCDGSSNCAVYSCALENKYCTDNDGTDDINTLECGAECDQDEDCGEGYECNLLDCSCVLSGEHYCGDGIKNEDEECDGQDFGSLNCNSFGYDNGLLTCASGCLINEDGCFNLGVDTDGDGIADSIDNCINIANPDQQDSDNDEIGNVCDDCPNDAQNDIDQDGVCGNVDFCPNDAQNDIDEDEYCANFDNCATVYNGNQLNSDNDIMGDACDNCPNDAKNDIDQDEICGDVDYLTGGYSTIKLNVSCFSFSVNDETDLNNFIGLGHVVIKECNDTMPLVEFDFNFGAYYLGLIDAMINTTGDGSGILVSNINLTDKNTTKTVYINRALSTDTVCVIDSEIASLSVSGDCSNGVKLTCNGSAGGYTCEKIENNTMYKITGLRHSAVMEYSYSAPQNNNNGGGGGGGGGGSSRGIVRNITPIATTSTVTIKPTPKKPAEAKPTPAETIFQEVAETIATEEITPSEILETVEKEGNFITGAIVAATSTVMGMLKNSRILRNIIIALVVLVIVFIVIYLSVNKYFSENKKKSKKSRKRKKR